jgi:hypothetical protein
MFTLKTVVAQGIASDNRRIRHGMLAHGPFPTDSKTLFEKISSEIKFQLSRIPLAMLQQELPPARTETDTTTMTA